MPSITPHLWYDTEAKDAAELYTSLLPGSEITNVTTLTDTPSGDCDVVSFVLAGQPFQAISAGPVFTLNPSISLRIDCSEAGEVDALWERLSAGGQALMPLDSYPFSARYGWCQDRFGLSWQIMLTDGEVGQKIVPMFLFVGDVCGKAEEAISFYASVFDRSKVGEIDRYGSGEDPDVPGTVRYAAFTLDGTDLAAMDSAHDHQFGFNEAVSLMVPCDTQEQIDYFWGKLSAVPEAEQCGWLKDRYGVSWQIVPAALDKMLQDDDAEARDRVTKAFLEMKKFDVARLEEAYAGR